MRRIAPEDVRRRQLIDATVDTMAEFGFAATTLALIGQRAGVSPGLIPHYFADKDGLLEATLRSLASDLARGLSARLRAARTPRERVQAVIDATLAPEQFEPRICGVWLAFWGQVPHSSRLKRIQQVYQRRMLSSLRHALKLIVPANEAERIARGVAAMIDGLWLRATLSSPHETDSATAREMASDYIDREIARIGQAREAPRPGGSAGRRGTASPELYRRALRRCRRRTELHHHQSGNRRNPRRGRDCRRGGGGERRRRGASGAAQMGGDDRRRTRPGAQARRRHPAGAQHGAGAARDAGYRQADPGDLGGRRDLGRRMSRIFRRARRRPLGRACRPRALGLRLYAPRAARHRRRHRRVELSRCRSPAGRRRRRSPAATP